MTVLPLFASLSRSSSWPEPSPPQVGTLSGMVGGGVMDQVFPLCGISNGDLFDGTQVQFWSVSVSLQKYVSTDNGGGGNVTLDRNVASSWKTFKLPSFFLGTYEKARLRFAHAETVIPFTCLLGLFLEGSEFERTQIEQPLDLPPKPPQRRNWIGSIVAPFAGNNMLVVFHCYGNDSKGIRKSGGSKSKYFVQVLHNEIPVPMPIR